MIPKKETSLWRNTQKFQHPDFFGQILIFFASVCVFVLLVCLLLGMLIGWLVGWQFGSSIFPSWIFTEGHRCNGPASSLWRGAAVLDRLGTDNSTGRGTEGHGGVDWDALDRFPPPRSVLRDSLLEMVTILVVTTLHPGGIDPRDAQRYDWRWLQIH